MKRTLLFLSLLSIIFWYPVQTHAVLLPVSRDVSITAFIGGEYFFSLYGYTSPNARVTMSSLGMLNETKSDTTGYFLFLRKPASLFHQEICIFAQDEEGRLSAPVCIPPIPQQDNLNIGPILLPPTVSLNNGALFIGEEPVLTGQTIPNTNVTLSLFTDENKSAKFLSFNPVKPAYAVTLPKLQIKSDEKGSYSIALSSSQAKYYRLFTQSVFQESLSPKSNTLHLTIFPFWIYLLRLFTFLWNALRGRFIDFLIISQLITIVLFVIAKYLFPRLFPKRYYPLALRPSHELMVEHIELMEIERSPLKKWKS